MISTSYVVAERRRLPDEAAAATQAPSLALISALVNAVEHAASSSAADSFAVSLCTFTPAIAASARSLAFAFNLASAMSARIESRVFSAAAFLSWAEVGDDDDDEVVFVVDGGGGGGEVVLVDGGGGGITVQFAAVSVPRLHELVPDTVYPELHVGWHVDPLANELVQSPTPPFVGAVDASQDKLNTRTWPALLPVPPFL
jgi:hypothetical protein